MELLLAIISLTTLTLTSTPGPLCSYDLTGEWDCSGLSFHVELVQSGCWGQIKVSPFGYYVGSYTLERDDETGNDEIWSRFGRMRFPKGNVVSDSEFHEAGVGDCVKKTPPSVCFRLDHDGNLCEWEDDDNCVVSVVGDMQWSTCKDYCTSKSVHGSSAEQFYCENAYLQMHGSCGKDHLIDCEDTFDGDLDYLCECSRVAVEPTAAAHIGPAMGVIG